MTTNVNLYVDQGADFGAELQVFDAEFQEFTVSNQTFVAKARKIYSSVVAFNLQVSIDTEDGDANNLRIFIPASTTESLVPGKYVYDVIMEESDGTKTKILEGLIIVLSSTSL